MKETKEDARAAKVAERKRLKEKKKKDKSRTDDNTKLDNSAIPQIVKWNYKVKGKPSADNSSFLAKKVTKLGVDCDRSSGIHHGIEIQVIISKHKDNFSYDIKRNLLGAKIWICDSQGNWKLDSKYAPASDDASNSDEDLVPNKLSEDTVCIYSLDRPGIGQDSCRAILLEQQEAEGSKPNFSKFRFVANFEEYLEINGIKCTQTFSWYALITVEFDFKKKVFVCNRDTKVNYIGQGKTTLSKPK